MCELLLPLEGCEVNLANPRSGCVALHVAVKKRCLPLVRLLLDSGADPTVKVLVMHTHTHTHPQSSAHPFPTAQDTAEQDSLDLCRKMRPDSELYLAVQAAHAQRCAWATMEAEEAEEEETAAASGQKAAADDAVDETTTAAAAEASTAAATDILAISSSPSHCASASDSGDSSNVVFAQLAQLYDDAAAGLPDQSTGSAAAAAAAAVGELHSAPGPTPAPAASSSLLPEGGGGGGGLFSRGRPPDSAIAAAAAAVSSSYSRPVPPKQPGAIGSSTARLSRIQIAAGHSLGPGPGAASSLKSDTVSGAAVVDKASATLRSSAYVYSTPQKSREQVQHACVALPYCALITCLLSCLPAGRQQLVAFPGHLLALAQSLAGREALTDGEAG